MFIQTEVKDLEIFNTIRFYELDSGYITGIILEIDVKHKDTYLTLKRGFIRPDNETTHVLKTNSTVKKELYKQLTLEDYIENGRNKRNSSRTRS